MSLDIERVLGELEEDEKEIRKNIKTVNFLREKQVEAVENLLKEYDKIMLWYVNKQIAFTHPNLRGKAFSHIGGPIVGYDEQEEKLFIYNYHHKRFEAVNIHKRSDAKTKNMRILIDQGYFNDIVAGIKHTLFHQKEVLKAQKNLIDTLEAQLNNC
ncbi:hypothetical protein SJY89_06455 [Bacillus velezensis]|uniref:hypothetical protein n=1 Tax=Bacillus TaxID=1386 RepID=UPI00066FE024|nr:MULTISPECIES: hypothetical protein [Bacillus]MDX7894862.1 hypothetical protein [Bacillus velezensis]MDX8026305.1 hypothetical protein [Bacillus velezensis]MDX8199091.1 hypothetical protein [Bacillus velezensis]MDX8224861.1 hypothetical protein [Bacillus velezensis]